MPDSEVSEYSNNIIKKLGIGAKRNPSAPPKVLLSNDFVREQVRQEIRGKVRRAQSLLSKRIEEAANLDGRPVVISEGITHRVAHLEFDTIYSGVDSEGKLFVSTSDSNISENTTLLFMSSKHKEWAIEPIVAPNLETAYFRKIAEIEEMCAKGSVPKYG